MKIKFTDAEIHKLVTYAVALGASLDRPHPLARWIDFNNSDVAITGLNSEGDTLVLNGPLQGRAAIHRFVGEYGCRLRVLDSDWTAIATVDTIYEAVAAVFLHEMEAHCRDIAMAVADTLAN
jgi:hypothetical protein